MVIYYGSSIIMVDTSQTPPPPLKNHMKFQCFHTNKKFVVGTSFRTFTFRIVMYPSKQFNHIDLRRLTLARGKIKDVCGDLGHCRLLFKSHPNAVYSPPNGVYWLQGSFMRSSFLPLLSFAASPPFKPEKNYTSFVF